MARPSYNPSPTDNPDKGLSSHVSLDTTCQGSLESMWDAAYHASIAPMGVAVRTTERILDARERALLSAVDAVQRLSARVAALPTDRTVKGRTELELALERAVTRFRRAWQTWEQGTRYTRQLASGAAVQATRDASIDARVATMQADKEETDFRRLGYGMTLAPTTGEGATGNPKGMRSVGYRTHNTGEFGLVCPRCCIALPWESLDGDTYTCPHCGQVGSTPVATLAEQQCWRELAGAQDYRSHLFLTRWYAAEVAPALPGQHSDPYHASGRGRSATPGESQLDATRERELDAERHKARLDAARRVRKETDAILDAARYRKGHGRNARRNRARRNAAKRLDPPA